MCDILAGSRRDPLLRDAPRTHFIIWFNERSGSTHLSSLLDSHPQVSCWREIFYRGEATCAEDYFDRSNFPSVEAFIDCFFTHRWGPDGTRMLIEHDLWSSPSAVGFKLKYQQLERRPEIRSYICARPQLKIIHLVRKNLLETLVSSRMVPKVFARFKAANLTLEMAGDELECFVDLNPYTIEPELRELESRIAVARTIVSQLANLEVTYEDLVTSTVDTCKLILEFLDVEIDHPLKTRYKKIMPRLLSKSIRNYDEIRNALYGTRFEYLLGEQVLWSTESIFT